MEESKAVATDRLRREGRWNEASQFKDQTIAELRKGGMSRQDAQAAGWAAMLDKFPPPADYPSDLAASANPIASGSDFVEAALWVFDNLARQVSVDSAPSAGAWAMLDWARTNRNDFFKAIVPKALDIRAKDMELDQQAAEEAADCESIRQLLGVE